MRILQVCKKSPTPQKDGESIAIHQMTRALQTQGHQVDVLAMLTAKHPEKDEKTQWPGVQYSYVKVESEVSVLGALKSVFTPIPYIVERFVNDIFSSTLVDKLEGVKYDLILLEGVFLGVYFDICRKYSKAKIVLRAHNIEHLIWKRHLAELSKGLKRWYLQYIMLPQFEMYEKELVKKTDGLIAISPVDLAFFAKQTERPMISIPVAANLKHAGGEKTSAKFAVGFLGALDWQPNFLGLRWFLDEVWCKFAVGKDVVLQVAGRNFPDEIYTWSFHRVELLGEIEDAEDFITNQRIIIVPVFSGSGMRVKVIEAMSLGKCVLSTSVGAEGIEVHNGEDILFADSPEQWLGLLEDLWLNQEKLKAIGDRAKENVRSTYSPDILAGKLQSFILAL